MFNLQLFILTFQGDGTAFIFKDNDSVFTFSMHCENNFPVRKQQSDLDVGLECGLEDKKYLHTLLDYLPWILDTYRPDLVLYDAGVDPHQDDALGKLNLTDQGMVTMAVVLSYRGGILKGDFLNIHYLHKSHNTPFLSPKNLHRHCF